MHTAVNPSKGFVYVEYVYMGNVSAEVMFYGGGGVLLEREDYNSKSADLLQIPGKRLHRAHRT